MSIYVHENIFDDKLLQSYFIPINSGSEFVPAHWHNHMEIILMTDGLMTANIASRQYELRKGDMLVVSPQDIHSTQYHGNISSILLQISYEQLNRSMPDFDLLHFKEFYSSDSDDAFTGKMKEYLRDMKALYEEKEDGFQLRFSALLYEFMYLLYRHCSSRITQQDRTKATRDIKRIEQIIRYVKLNYHESISLNNAAAAISISPEYFCRLFKAYTGQTFLEYLNSVRLVYFYNDLMQTNDTVTYLMEKNGITNYKVFLKLFKRTYGSSPQQLRKEMTEKTME